MKQFFKLTPILLLAALVISEVDTLVAAPIATVYAVIVCVMTQKCSLKEVLDSAIESAKGGMIVYLVLMLAYAVAEIFMVTGVGALVIQMALGLGVTARNVAVIAFLVTCVLSVSTGTSWGTFAACIPIFLWLSHIVGGDAILVLCAVGGGAVFGDSIALISDTTIFSCGIFNVEASDRFRHQGVWYACCVGISAVLFYVTARIKGLADTAGDVSAALEAIPNEAFVALEEKRPAAIELLNQVAGDKVPLYMIVPVVLIVGLAMMQIPTIACLLAGIVSAAILGIFAGTITSFAQVTDIIYSGFSGAGEWVVIMMMWILTFGGVMARMDAFAPIARFFVKIAGSVRQLMTCNALLLAVGNILLSEEVTNMATVGPLVRSITEDNIEASKEDIYTLNLRNATFSDTLGVLGSQVIPWHVGSIYYIGLAGAVYPLLELTAVDLMRYNYMVWIAMGSLILLTLTGWDRFIPMFRLPREPEIYLKHSKRIKNETNPDR